MLKGFKEFVSRGNVVDLAVGVVMGAAFGAVVQSFTGSFLNPLIKVLTGGKQVGGAFVIRGVEFPWSAFVNQVITFLLTAAGVYFLVVLPMNRLAKLRKRGIEPEPEAPSDEVRLLTEIRDALQPRPEADRPTS